jgi:glucan phosphorylase
MPNIAEVEPRMTSNGAVRTRGRRDDLRSILEHLAYNLRWSWNPATVELFRTLGPDPWQRSHNPVSVLRTVDSDVLTEHAEALLDRSAELDHYLNKQPALGGIPRIAYFSAEFAITEALPIYSGGLGVLAGDHLKSASDLGLPLVAVGLLYRYGYFRQVIDHSGYQHEAYDRLDSDAAPIRRVLDAHGQPVMVGVPFPGRTVHARVWLAQVGRVPLYLLDTDLAENREDDRWIPPVRWRPGRASVRKWCSASVACVPCARHSVDRGAARSLPHERGARRLPRPGARAGKNGLGRGGALTTRPP